MKIKKFFYFSITIIGIILLGCFYFSDYRNFSNYNSGENSNPNQCPSSEVIVTKVIDGDTIVVEGGYHIRLLGIDADEKNYPCYEEAKKRLEELILNKKVRLEKGSLDLDQYDRCLRYIFLGDENINLEMVKEGLAVARFYSPEEKYRNEISQAEKEAMTNKIGCKWKEKGGENELKVEDSEQWQRLTSSRTGYKLIKACQAGDYLGEKVIAEGRIVDTYYSSSKGVVFLNFEKPYPNQCLTGVIFSDSLENFKDNPQEYYLNKIVRIIGEVKEYKNRPEIILDTPQQIEVLE